MEPEWKRRIRARLKELKLSMQAASEQAGQKPTWLRDVLRNPKQSPQLDRAIALSRVLQLTIGELVGEVDLPRRRVAIIAYVGAGDEMYPLAEPFDEVDAPPGAPETAQAVIVRGDSMAPAYKPGDVLIFVPGDYSLETLIGRDCVVQLDTGRMLIKTLRRGSRPGRWTLESYGGEPMRNVVVARAAPIRWVEKA